MPTGLIVIHNILWTVRLQSRYSLKKKTDSRTGSFPRWYWNPVLEWTRMSNGTQRCCISCPSTCTCIQNQKDIIDKAWWAFFFLLCVSDKKVWIVCNLYLGNQNRSKIINKHLLNNGNNKLERNYSDLLGDYIPFILLFVTIFIAN